MSQFSENFHKLRREAGISQDEVAQALGIAKSTVSMYERGNRRPNLAVLTKLAELLNVSVDALVGTAQPEPEQEPPREITVSDPELIEFLEMLRTRPECRMLMSTMRTATKTQIAANVAFIESLRSGEE